MTKYRVKKNPTFGSGFVSEYFRGGEIVDTSDVEPDETGDFYLLGSTRDPEKFHYVNIRSLEPLTEPVRIWSEHLADINHALKILSDATKALKDAAPEGQPGHWSDLEFDFPGRVPINLDGEPTGWALEFVEDWDDWVLVIDVKEENNA